MHTDLLGGTIAILLKTVLRYGEVVFRYMSTRVPAETSIGFPNAGVSVATEFFGKGSLIAKARRS